MRAGSVGVNQGTQMVYREQHPDQGSALLRIYERLQAPPLQEGDLKLGLYRALVCNHRVTVLANHER